MPFSLSVVSIEMHNYSINDKYRSQKKRRMQAEYLMHTIQKWSSGQLQWPTTSINAFWVANNLDQCIPSCEHTIATKWSKRKLKFGFAQMLPIAKIGSEPILSIQMGEKNTRYVTQFVLNARGMLRISKPIRRKLFWYLKKASKNISFFRKLQEKNMSFEMKWLLIYLTHVLCRQKKYLGGNTV